MRWSVSFAGLRGQDRALEFLKKSIEANTVAQAYIFAGPKGTGRFTTALEFAKALNCDHAQGGDACDVCAPCARLGRKSHPDLIVVAPDQDGLGEVKVDMVRKAQYLIHLTPYEMRKKVCIIDGSDKMNQEASNALLKTLEEPPADSVIILIVENVANLLVTVTSRCQLVRFFPLPLDELARLLVSDYHMDETKARFIAHLASGRIGAARRFEGDDLLRKKNSLIDAAAGGFLLDDETPVIAKGEMPWALDVILSWYRDIVMAKLGMERSVLINIDRYEAIRKAASDTRISVDRLADLAEEIVALRFYLRQNVNHKLAWTVLGQKIEDLRTSEANGERKERERGRQGHTCTK